MSDLRPVAVAVAVLGLFVGGLAAFGRFMPLILDQAPAQADVAVAAVNVLGFLLAPVAVAVVGYGAGGRVDVSEAYVRIAAIFGIVGGVAALVGGLVVTVAGVDAIGRASSVRLVFTLVTPVATGVYFALTGLAAAAVAQFRGA